MIVLDTNVISELMRPRPDPAVLTWLDRRAGDCMLSTIVIFEVRVGICNLPSGRRRDELMGSFERIIARFGPRVIAFDRASAEMAAELAAASESQGRVMSTGDAQIAGSAAVYGLTLVTRNLKDFATCGIDVVNPWNA